MFRISRAGMGHDACCRSIFFYVSLAQDQQGICHICGQTDIVGDENDGRLMMTAQAQQGIGHFFLGHAVYG